MKVSVIIVAAGSGRRFGYERNKLFFPLCGKPVLTHTLQHVFAAACVSEVVIVVAERDRRDIEDMVAGLHPSVPVRFALGGAEREDSVYNGLVAADESADIVMVHDGSRPMAGPEWFDNAVPVMEKANVAVYAIPVKDTVKEREEAGAWGLQRVRTLDRSRLIAVQTPQIFRRQTLLEAHRYAKEHHLTGTDDASLAEAMGEKVVILQGDERNHKVTTMDDVPVLEFYMTGPSEHRVGSGYDVHPLVSGRKLILGGVEIPYEKGLDGHSDADVLVHAVMDALLGAAGLKDIGTYFPDTDAAFKNISSLILLRKVRQILIENSCRVINVDVTLLAQQPKIKPYVAQMTANLADALQIDPSAVCVKATTTEHLGFVGRQEGMAAQAAAMVIKYRN
ncbi:2-C-methyl-D-erythritol 2,4-cyclodiphosphate synthase [Megasphaera hexanoica]|uniref:Bifunctional enzyme IspD/IspF n=1 Tax=Megasphaera hexanoica TaxID=1675036 RepID=A0A848BVK0_9FIRM|nr:2-C-methyl-D-erythritol 4-phosphate cytidylyltransferase [Megasphaera hexanoica]AXB81912.1 2-C-methyl-D-erythritol 2,4-cyclodiphosphate synthase [Megasphaera hexanoica]NME28274.1 2-C-methyl-D-erythritol 2,4-cyclodiphosphate synthase [Megasphaera hexanoica]